MTVRTTKFTVTFLEPFTLSDFDEVLPPGPYDVETEEELLDGLSFPAYRRLLTLIHLPLKRGHPGVSQTLAIDPNELDAALKRDRDPASGTPSTERLSVHKSFQGTPTPPDAETDRQAVDRAEDEGMNRPLETV